MKHVTYLIRTHLSHTPTACRLQACVCTCMHRCKHVSAHACTDASMCLHMHTPMQAYVRTCMQRCKHMSAHACTDASICPHMHAPMQACVRTCIHRFKHVSAHACKDASMWPHMHPPMQACIRTCMHRCARTYATHRRSVATRLHARVHTHAPEPHTEAPCQRGLPFNFVPEPKVSQDQPGVSPDSYSFCQFLSCSNQVSLWHRRRHAGASRGTCPGWKR